MKSSTPRSIWLTYAAFIGLNLLIGFGGAFSTSGEIDGWYAGLVKPSWNPPNWLFAPVWTTLYVLIGISGAMIWRADASQFRRRALLAYWTQLLLNAIWTPLFFGLHQVSLALLVILLMDVAVMLTIAFAIKIRRPAAYLLLPYLAWILFATSLNWAILILN